MSWSHPALESVALLFEERTGVVFPPERRARAELGVRRALARTGYDDLERYRNEVGRNGILFDDLVAELTVGETYFFREPDQFAFVRDTILPASRQRDDTGSIRAWSAGCASGEEAYSLAMVFTAEGLAGRSHVLATDLSRAGLIRAREGIYSAWSLRGEGAEAARSYLENSGEDFRVNAAVRRLVTFEHLNLALDVYPSFANGTCGIDLIFCRNVLIYFDRETVSAVAGRLFSALAEGGWLVTASSDPPLGNEAPFQTVVTDHGLFYQRPAAEPLPTPVSPFVRGGDVRLPLLATAGTREIEPPSLVADVLQVRALANLDIEQAEQACSDAIGRHPLSTELYYLRALLLLGLGHGSDAARAARRVIYLDRALAAAYFLLGSILQQEGDAPGARRAYRNARDLASAQPPAAEVPLAEGETAAQLAERAGRQLARLDAIKEVRP